MDINLWHITNCIFSFWSVISGALDLHNNVAKIIGIRKMWIVI
ncbi:hypothetical protein BANRA_02153 [Escherichia coli]|nr:hypothetical protein BANRA_02153 [Escherichia coli]